MKQLIKGFTKTLGLSSLILLTSIPIGYAANQTIIEHCNLETKVSVSKTTFFAQEVFTEISTFIKNNTQESDFLEILNPQNDGVEADACHHNVLYQDKIIRVLNVIVPPNVKEVFHTHELPAVMYVDMPSNQITLEIIENGKIVRHTFQSTKGFSFVPGESLHSVENLDTEKPYLAFRFEIRKLELKENTELQKKIIQFIESKQGYLDSIRSDLSSHPERPR